MLVEILWRLLVSWVAPHGRRKKHRPVFTEISHLDSSPIVKHITAIYFRQIAKAPCEKVTTTLPFAKSIEPTVFRFQSLSVEVIDEPRGRNS